jgi:outer membrane autotransporter protein
VGNSNQILNLLPGARIIGTIDLGSGTNAVNITTSAGQSTTLTIANAGTVTHSGPGLVVTSGDVISVVDTTSFIAAQSAPGNTSAGIVQAINAQLRHPTLQKPITLAAKEITPAMVNLTSGPTTWAHLLGSQASQASTTTALAYKDNSYGVIGGYEQTLSEHRVGFFGGVIHADTYTDTASSRVGSDTAFGGVYGQYVKGMWKFNGSVTVGYSNNASQRTVTDNLAGVQIGTASFNTTFVSPSVSVARDFAMGAGWTLSPSAELSYSYATLAGYTESGTTNSNLAVGSRAATSTGTRVQVAARKLMDGASGDYELRLGAINRDYGGDNLKVSLQGSPASTFDIGGTPGATGAFLGASGRVEIRKYWALVADVQYARYSGNSTTASGYVGVAYRY